MDAENIKEKDFKKNRRVTVTGKNGETYHFKFKPVVIKDSNEMVCENNCPYNNICDEIRDPRDIDNPDRCFSDFCAELGESDEEEEDLLYMIPDSGSLEEGFKNRKDIFQQIIKEDPVIRLKDLIDSVCADGWCPEYLADHSNCNSCNLGCILHNLFIKIENKDE